MKIAFLSPFYPYRGGIAEFSNSLFLELSKNNEIEAFTFRKLYPVCIFPGTDQKVPQGDIRHDISARGVLDTLNPLTYAKTAELIVDSKPDLVIISFWMPFFAPALGKVAKILRKKNIKVVSIIHNIIPHESRLGDAFLTKYFLKNIDGAILLNKKSEKDLLQLKPEIKHTISFHPVYNNIHKKRDIIQARKDLDIPSGKKVILFFGLIRDYKGLDLLIESVKYLSDDYLLVIAGEVYGDFKSYQRIIDRYSLSKKIKLYLKYIPDSEIVNFFSAADVCILPYKSGSQSGVISSAYNFDLPIIATDVGGLKEMIDHEQTGLIVKNIDPQSIAQSIQKYFDQGMKEKMIPYIQKYKISHSWDKLAVHIMNFAKTL